MEKVQQAVLKLLFPAPREKESLPQLTAAEELNILKERIAAARTRFEFATADGETEAAIYDLNALEIRYDLLLRRIKNGEE